MWAEDNGTSAAPAIAHPKDPHYCWIVVDINGYNSLRTLFIAYLGALGQIVHTKCLKSQLKITIRGAYKEPFTFNAKNGPENTRKLYFIQWIERKGRLYPFCGLYEEENDSAGDHKLV